VSVLFWIICQCDDFILTERLADTTTTAAATANDDDDDDDDDDGDGRYWDSVGSVA